jgi:hypothetical protein
LQEGDRELRLQLGSDLGEPDQRRVDLGELAPVDRDRVRTAPAAGVAVPQALDERARLLQGEPQPDERADLGDGPQVRVVVGAVAVRRRPAASRPSSS